MSYRLLQTLLPILTSTPSKSLRTLLYQKITSDLRTSSAKHTNQRLNRTVQSVLYDLLVSDREASKGIWAVKITRELWKRQVWTDAKAVEIMKEASLADNVKVIVGGVGFFLGGDKEREELEDESSDDDAVDMGRLKHQIGINKKTKKRTRAVENAIATVKKKEKKRKQPHPLNFSAFHLLHDPQGYAESIFSRHLQSPRSKLNLEQKLLVLQLVSRLVGLHKLTILPLYSYFLKYLHSRQPSVTSFLASLAQATHSLVPPEDLEPLIQKIANEFVSEAAAAEVASAGLNGIREICIRQPLAMNPTLLQDLVMYKKSKDKGVMMAAKGLLGLYREIGADMLKKKDRGKEAAMSLRAGDLKNRRFGEDLSSGIEGLELLEKWKEEEKQRKRSEMGLLAETAVDEAEVDESNQDGWELDDAGSEDSGGWINVESDNEIDISDSDEDNTIAKRLKREFAVSNEGEDKENEVQIVADPVQEASSLASKTILTPADHAKLRELQLEASVNKLLPFSQRKRMAQQQAQLNRHVDDPLTAAEIEGLASLSKKMSKVEKVAHAKEGQAGRPEHKSTQAIRKSKKEAQGKSSTNKEKARKKNFMMTLGKAKGKQKRSLIDRGKALKAHVERSKHGGRRGNKGH